MTEEWLEEVRRLHEAGDKSAARLLSRKGSKQYLDDVRTLIAERDGWRQHAERADELLAMSERARERSEAEVAVLQTRLASADNVARLRAEPRRSLSERVFGSIRTNRVDE